MTRREPRVPAFMAHPARDRRSQRPDSAMENAKAVAIGVALFVVLYWLAPILSAPVR